MRFQTLAALTLCGYAAAADVFSMDEAKPVLRSEVFKNEFGSMVTAEYYQEGSAKTVFVSQKDLVRDYERQTQILKTA